MVRYRVFTYIYHKNQPNVHGCYGIGAHLSNSALAAFPVSPRFPFFALPSKLLLQWWGTEPWRTWKWVSRRSSWSRVVPRWAPWTDPVFEWGEITDSYIYMAENKLNMDKSGVITLLIGVLTPFMTGRGSPCWTLLRYMYLGDTEFALLKVISVLLFNVLNQRNDKHILHAGMPNKAHQLYRGRYMTNQNNAPL